MANNGGASNKNESQIKRRRRLPLELQCEVFCALPFQYGRRMLLLCRPIALNCGVLARKQKQKIEEFKNRWDPTACHGVLTIFEPKRLVALFTGKGSRSVFAERPIPKKDKDRRNIFSIGLASKQMSLDVWVGFEEGTYAYASCGYFMGHAVEGCYHSFGRPYIRRGTPKFGQGDIIGCGINLATRQIIYTKNGQRLETTGLFVDSVAELFPCVTLLPPAARFLGNKIEANFGPNFKFKMADDGI
uniref:B30.2/SPRY domain-containing protein n=1 Tax=Globodera rostochiensis TaxID=31243 RepID=A0A914HL39_GLORO